MTNIKEKKEIDKNRKYQSLLQVIKVGIVLRNIHVCVCALDYDIKYISYISCSQKFERHWCERPWHGVPEHHEKSSGPGKCPWFWAHGVISHDCSDQAP